MDKRESTASRVFFYVFAAAVALLVGGYLAAFSETVRAYWANEGARLAIADLGITFFLFALLCAAIVFAVLIAMDRFRAVPRWLIRHRFILSGVVLVVCCALGISGSSIGIWQDFLGNDGINNTLFGMPRDIRSDEWVVSTPFSLSQVETGNQPISPVIRGGGTDGTLSPALPSWFFSTLFRPYYWGYLVLGMAGGVAFTWVGRALALALVTFEFARIITKGDDALSACAAVLVTFAPVVQWWGATNLLIFGQGLVVCLNALLRATTRPRRWLIAVILWYLLCCYALELYPAWQVPLFYVFAAAGVWVCLQVKAERNVSWRELLGPIVLPFAVAAACFVAVVAFCIWNARDVVAATSGTVYPGARSENGGGMLETVVTYLKDCSVMVAAPMAHKLILPNVCEASTAIALFPLGIIVAVVKMVRGRDLSPLFLLIPYAFFALYGIIGFPDPLAHATLMSNVPLKRLAYPVGYLDIMLLIFACSMGGKATAPAKLDNRVRVIGAIAVALAYAALMAFCARRTLPDGSPVLLLVFVGGVSLLGVLALLLPSDLVSAGGRSRGKVLATWSVLVLCAGLCVNPIQMGVAELMEDDVTKMVDEVQESDPDATWVGQGSPLAQACIVTGAKTLNSINSYPNLDLWHRIDPEGEYENVYNRYAHIGFDVTNDDKTSFELVGEDSFIVHLNGEGVEKLGIDYLLTSQDLTECNSGDVKFVPLDEADGYTVYHVER